MAAGDIYHISGDLAGRHATAFLGGNVDDGIQINAFGAARVAAGDSLGTFTAWIMCSDIASSYTILSVSDANVIEYIDFRVASGKLSVKCADATVIQFNSSSDDIVITPHKWHHVALRQDGGMPRLYVDGVEVAVTHSTSTDLPAWFDQLAGVDNALIGGAQISGDASISQEFKGAISDVKYWNVALTNDQILDDYNRKPNTTSLTDHWDMDNGFVNLITAANNGTAVGAVILNDNYSQFTSRLRYVPAAPPVVADDLHVACDRGTGHAILVKAA